MAASTDIALPVSQLDIPLERDLFLRTLIRELSGVLQDVVGVEEASGFVSIVGANMGEQINSVYKAAWDVSKLSEQQVVDCLLDLKRRIQGDFYLIEHTGDKLVFGNHVCPFEDKVEGRTSMCMMTSNVFGNVAAQNLGYSKVDIQQSIAAGDKECRVVVHLKRTPEADACDGREYYQDESTK